MNIKMYYSINSAAIMTMMINVLFTTQKMKFSIKDFFSKCDQIDSSDLVTFADEILNRKFGSFFVRY